MSGGPALKEKKARVFRMKGSPNQVLSKVRHSPGEFRQPRRFEKKKKKKRLSEIKIRLPTEVNNFFLLEFLISNSGS